MNPLEQNSRNGTLIVGTLCLVLVGVVGTLCWLAIFEHSLPALLFGLVTGLIGLFAPQPGHQHIAQLAGALPLTDPAPAPGPVVDDADTIPTGRSEVTDLDLTYLPADPPRAGSAPLTPAAPIEGAPDVEA